MNKFKLKNRTTFFYYLLFVFCCFSSLNMQGQCANNLLDNGGFESGFADWNNRGTAEISSDAYTGNNAVRMCDFSGDQRVLQATAVTAGQEYNLRYFSKADINSLAVVYWKFLTSSYQPIPGTELSISWQTYTETNRNFIAPANAAFVEIGIDRRGLQTGCVFVDDFCLAESGNNSTCNLNIEILNIECLGLDTPPTSDDLFNIDYQVTATNGSSSGFTSIIQGGLLEYGQVIQAFNLPVYNGPSSITVQDADDSNCSATIGINLEACQTGLPDPEIDFYNLFAAQGNGMPPYRAEFRGRNFGPEVNNVNVELYLSTDPTFSNNDILVDMSVEDFPTNAVREWAYTILGNNNGVSAGNYYVIMVVDPDDLIAELNEDNNVLVWPTTINMPGTTGNGVDLELSISADDVLPGIYEKVTLTYTLTNAGTATATGIEVFAGMCSGGANTSLFMNSEQLVLSSPSPVASVGSFQITNQLWTIPELAAGASADLVITVFTLTELERFVLGYVTQQNEDDVDSTPDFSNNCSISEDDEAFLRINSNALSCGGELIVTTQAELENLSACTVYEGDLTISGEDITDLTPLSNLERVIGNLSLFVLPTITNLSGLENLEEVTNIFGIQTSYGLEDISALSSLQRVGGRFVISENSSLINLDGLENLSSVGGLSIREMNISDIDGLRNLQEVTTGGIVLNELVNITDVDALSNITSLPDVLSIFRNTQLENVDGLSNILEVGRLTFRGNTNLSNCCGIFPLLNNDGVAGELNFGNQSACETVQDVLDNCDSNPLLTNLTADTFSGQTFSYQPGESSNLGFNLINNTTIDAPGNLMEVYLSTDNQLSNNDVLIGSDNANSLAAQMTRNEFVPIQIPNSTTLGNYFIIVVTDADEQILESNENDNETVYPGVITGNTGNTMDLDLSLTADNPNPNIYTHVNFTATLTNTGDTNATGVVVDFPIPSGLTHSSNSATMGSYNLFARKWNVGTLAAGQSATLNLRLFVLSSDEIPVFTQVASASPSDADSTPGNGVCCIANEDDEAVITLNGPVGGDCLVSPEITSTRCEDNGTSNDPDDDIFYVTLCVLENGFCNDQWVYEGQAYDYGECVEFGPFDIDDTGDAPILQIYKSSNPNVVVATVETTPPPPCSDGCICPAVYDPVCGSDGVTYGNACEAACAGIFNYTPGECLIGGEECGFLETYNENTFESVARLNFNETANAYHFSTTFTPFNTQLSEVTSFSVDLEGNALGGLSTETVPIERLISTAIDPTGSVELQRIATSGNEIWTKTVALNAPVPISFVSTGTSFEVADGFFFTGYIANTMTGIDYYPYTIKTDFDGNVIDQNFFPQQNFNYTFRSIETDIAGNHYFELLTSPVQIILFKTDNNGAYLWDTQIASDLPSNKVTSVRPSADGASVYVLRRNDFLSFVKRLDASTGNEIWEESILQLFGIGSNTFVFTYGILPTSDGGFVTTVNLPNSSGEDNWYGKFSANGNSVWQYDLANHYRFTVAGHTSDSGFIFVGSDNGNFTVLKTTSTGEITPECGDTDPCVDADCPAIYDPVCGSDGVTYGNSCEAICAGVTNFTSGECPVITDGVDLELDITAPANYTIYTKVLFQIRVFNNGTINAENVKVSVPIPDGFVHSSNSTTNGTFDLFRESWNAGTIKVGETAVLDLNLFALTSNVVTLYAQVSNANPDDVDSTPNNGTCCTPNEDDEAAITIGTNLQGGNGASALSTPNANRDLDIKTIYPNVATDEITIFVQSKLPELKLRVYNLQGHEVLQQKYQDTKGFQRLHLDVTQLPTGTYLLRFDGTLGQQTLRFLKIRM